MSRRCPGIPLIAAKSLLRLTVAAGLLVPLLAAPAQGAGDNRVTDVQYHPDRRQVLIHSRAPVKILKTWQTKDGRHFHLVLKKIGHTSKLKFPLRFNDDVLQALDVATRGKTTTFEVTTREAAQFTARSSGGRVIISWQPQTPPRQENVITELTVIQTLYELLSLQCQSPPQDLKLYYAPDRNRLTVEIPHARLTSGVKRYQSIQDDVLDSVRVDRVKSTVKVIISFSEAKASSYRVVIEENRVVVAPKPSVIFVQTLNQIVENLRFTADLTVKYARDVEQDHLYESSRDIRSLLVAGVKYEWEMQNYIKAGVRLRYIEEYDPGFYTLTDLRPTESYINQVGEFWRLAVGYQTVRWGRTDEISPLDVVNPEDLTEYWLNDRPERKLPVPLARATWFNEYFNLEALYVPWVAPSLIIYRDADWALTDHAVDLLSARLAPQGAALKAAAFEDEERSGPFWEHAEGGLRLTKSFTGFDMGLCYYYGHDKTPLVRAPTPGGAAALSLLLDPRNLPLALASWPPAFWGGLTAADLAYTLVYPRFTLYGWDVEAAIGDVGARAEVAYFENRHFQRLVDLGEVTRNEIHYVIGADYHVWENFYVNVLFSQALILDYAQPLLNARESQRDAAGSLSWDMVRDTLTLKTNGLYNLEDGSLALRTGLIWHQSDSAEFELGWIEILAPEDAAAYAYKHNNQVYLKGSFHF